MNNLQFIHSLLLKNYNLKKSCYIGRLDDDDLVFHIKFLKSNKYERAVISYSPETNNIRVKLFIYTNYLKLINSYDFININDFIIAIKKMSNDTWERSCIEKIQCVIL